MTFPPHVEDAISALAGLDQTSPQIRRALLKVYPEKDVPDERTIDRRRKEERAARSGEPWIFEESGDDEAELVLPVLAEKIRQTRGHQTTLESGEARWIARIRRAAPDVPLALAAQLALRAGRGDVSAVLSVLAFAPWRDDEHARRYTEAVLSGWLPRPEPSPRTDPESQSGVAPGSWVAGYLELRGDTYFLHKFVGHRSPTGEWVAPGPPSTTFQIDDRRELGERIVPMFDVEGEGTVSGRDAGSIASAGGKKGEQQRGKAEH